MKRYVYELYNELGSIEYVGETGNPTDRFRRHTKLNPITNFGHGKFYGRTDIHMNIVAEFDTRKESYAYQCQLQNEYGFKSDADVNSEGRIGNKNHFYKKSHSEESKQKISQSQKLRLSIKKQLPR